MEVPAGTSREEVEDLAKKAMMKMKRKFGIPATGLLLGETEEILDEQGFFAVPDNPSVARASGPRKKPKTTIEEMDEDNSDRLLLQEMLG